MAQQLTGDELDGLGWDALHGSDPRAVRAELVAAVDEDRIADPEDVPYALRLAAELAEGQGEQDEALALSARAVAVAQDGSNRHWVRAGHADLLLQLGYADDGLTVLRGLRPQLTRDPGAATYVVDPLVDHGRAELAEQWLTAALATAREVAGRTDEDSEASLDAWEIVDRLMYRRRAVRGDLGLPPDTDDLEVDELDALPDIVFWPRSGYESLLAAHPEVAEELGTDWDEHRALIERAMQESDPTDLPVVEVATPGMLIAALGDDDAADAAPGPLLEWPPGRNDPCWCSSGAKYKKCCLPRTR